MIRQGEEPMDRLTRMADAMTETFDAHPEHLGSDRCVVLVDDAENGGIALHGYEDMGEALVDMLGHLQVLARSIGKVINIIGVPDDVSELLNDE